MAHVSQFFFLRHLRAQPNQHVLHFRKGRLVRSGAGLAYWFSPLSAALAEVPIEDIQTTFVLTERSSDFQEIKVQVTLAYRVVDPVKAAQRVNFGLAISTGAWVEEPLRRLETLWAQWSRHTVRSCLIGLPVVDVVREGADRMRERLDAALRGNPEIDAIGLGLVSVQIDQVSPTAELEKALQTPTREAIQQKADEAAFARRALAVEKERAIKENELATEVELARRQEELIRQEGANQKLAVEQEAARQRLAAEGQAERTSIAANAKAAETRTLASAEAEARGALLEVEVGAESRRVELWKAAPASAGFGLAAQRLAEKIQSVGHVNLTPDLLGQVLQKLLLGEADRSE